MNKVMLMGRLTKDPEVRYSQGENPTTIVRYTLAVDRRFKRDGEPTADFIPCIAFGRPAEFTAKYFHQGLKVVVIGRIQTGSYTNRDGQKVYTTDVVVEEQEFADSKNSGQQGGQYQNNGNGQQGGQYQNNGGGQQGGQFQNNGGGQSNYGGGSFGMGDDGFMNIPEGLDEELPFN